MPAISCPNCQTEIDQTYAFCHKCGFKVEYEKYEKPKQEEASEIVSPQTAIETTLASSEINSPATTTHKETYSSGVKTTFIWSTLLTVITVLFYTFKGMANADVVAQNLIQGVFARPLVVLLIAFIISIFFQSKEKKISKFNSASTFIMAILTIGELGRWFVIGGT